MAVDGVKMDAVAVAESGREMSPQVKHFQNIQETCKYDFVEWS